tara:strand:+ start:166 stop:954 length:789 start_codon:yes stop_codon:yes gene_type:complete
MNILCKFGFIVIFVILPLISVVDVHAKENEKKSIFDGKVVRAYRHFSALKELNVRNKPMTKSKRLGLIKKGDRVEVLGRVGRTQWFVIKYNKARGFVYRKLLAPVLDGSVAEPLKGKLGYGTFPLCTYVLTFKKKESINNSLQVISNYLVKFSCQDGKKTFSFEVDMFLTELAYRYKKTYIFQVNLDIPNVLDETGERISVTSLYNIKEGVLEPLSSSDFQISSKNQKESEYTSIKKVLRSAIINSYMQWGHGTWKKIISSN